MATCWLAVLPSGTSYGFTDHDKDIVVSGWSAPDNILHKTYAAASGFTAKSIATSDALNVDNTDAEGVLVSPAITEADLLAGRWDGARIYIFKINWADVTMGPLYQRVGFLGEVSTGRVAFKAELRGLMQRYTGSLCELTSPSCRADLGDTRCAKDLTTFTATGTLTGVAADNTTLYDTGRAESGPGGGVAITGITNANPGVVTMTDDSLHLVEGQAVTISGVGGMTPVNAVTIARNPSGVTFELGVDTTDTGDYPAYTSGGTVTPLGSATGYFDFGKIAFTGGLNNGLSREIKAYVPGQITLYLPLPYLAAIGDTYSIVAGCDKSFATCRDRFDNVVNFRGEPYVPGVDKMVQIGRGGG
jgi:uncharacterized phage protein (TIGR02218 family)